MSYMLKSAAMSLLSKTLQTFLYKYLSDVDVQGVAMPSLMFDTSSESSSGWGVRLCNVKLREGVELMTLPGKRRRRKRERKRHEQQPPKDGDPHQRRTTKQSSSTPQSSEAVVENEVTDRSVPKVVTAGATTATVSPSPSPATLKSPEMAVMNHQGEETTTCATDAEEDDDTVDNVVAATRRPIGGGGKSETTTSSRSNSPVPPPPSGLICGRRRSSVMSCLSRRSRKDPTVCDTDDDEEEMEENSVIDVPSAPPSYGTPLVRSRSNSVVMMINNNKTNVVFDAGDLEKLSSPINTVAEQPSATTVHDDGDDDEKHEKAPLLKERELSIMSSVASLPDMTTADDGPMGDDDDGDGDEYMDVEEDMILQLGNGGRIGTLDVRLVGKDLHVTVEDAYLTVEAWPKPEVVADDAASVNTANTSDTTKSDGKSKPKDKKTAKKAPASKKETDKTDAEKVMEASAIARAFAAIPHLFLRDVSVRIILRKEAAERKEDGTWDDQVMPDDSVVEASIELLSVTSGEDILANVRFNEEESGDGSDEHETEEVQLADEPRPKSKPSLKALEEANENEYLVKRIRTGSGPEGGLSIRVYPPVPRRPKMLLARKAKSRARRSQQQLKWARQLWEQYTQFSFFRFSNLDVRARIYLGKKKDIALRNNDYAWYGEEYEEYTIDSMLYGVDYIAPAPPPPRSLPPMDQPDTPSKSPRKRLVPEADDYSTDQNGIQSSKVRSSFHKVARGLVPTLCKKNHLPCEHCPYCWENPSRPNSYSEHPLDSATPLPGVVFNVSLNDPLEINVDRQGLEVLGELKSLFAKPAISDDEVPSAPERSLEKIEEEGSGSNSKKHDQKKKWTFRKQKPKKESIKDAFPSYMKPENIEFMGVHVAKVVLRLHAMSDAPSEAIESGLSFRYWELKARCITMDLQKLSTKQKNMMDVRLDLGYLTVDEYCGIEINRLVSIGLPNPDVSDSDSVSQASGASGSQTLIKAKNGTLWPSTASSLLHVPIPGETIEYATRERHGVQLRYVTLSSATRSTRASANVRFGAITVDTAYKLISRITGTIAEAQTAVLGPPRRPLDEGESSPSQRSVTHGSEEPAAPPKTTLLKYKVQIESGKVRLDPLIRARLPLTKFDGVSSTDDGFSIHSLLKHIELEYGKASGKQQRRKQLSIQQMAALPDSVRLSIIMCLKDLSPLENAFWLEREGNSFLRVRAVNRAIVQHGKRPQRVVKRKKSKSSVIGVDGAVGSNRRQAILTELMKLDDRQLEDLWNTYKRTKVDKPTT